MFFFSFLKGMGGEIRWNGDVILSSISFTRRVKIMTIIFKEYDRHLGIVNSLTFFDKNRRFCSTSDDKSIRIWEWLVAFAFLSYLTKAFLLISYSK